MLIKGLVFAHVPIGQYNLPVPLLQVLLAAVAVVALSFVLIYVAPPAGREEDEGAGRPVAAGVVLGLAAFFGFYTAFIVLISLLGRQQPPGTILNAGAMLFWVWTIPLLPLAHCLVGGIYEAANPFALIAERLSGGRTVPNAEAILDRLGYWPAVVLMFLLVMGESIPEIVSSPMFLGLVGLAYCGVQVVMGMMLGRGWYRGGDLFQAITALASTIAPVALRRDAAGVTRFLVGFNPARFLPHGRGREPLITLWLAGVLADGVRVTPIWKYGIYPRSHPFFESIPRIGDPITPGAFSFDVGNALEITVEILFTWIAFAVFFWLFVYVASLLARRGEQPARHDLSHMAGVVSPSLIPIALAYLLAHNLTQLLVVGPLVVSARDATAAQLPGLIAAVRVHIQPGPVWWTQVTAIVVGHILAVVMAHARLSRAFADQEESTEPAQAVAFRSDLGWLSAMLIYTATSLWILAQPITSSG